MYREVTGYIKENHMIEKGDTVLAGVSGGGDSVTMLYILKEYQKELEFTLRVVHVHHGIRGEEADRDSRFVQELCAGWEIPCRVYSYDVPALSASGSSSRGFARALGKCSNLSAQSSTQTSSTPPRAKAR